VSELTPDNGLPQPRRKLYKLTHTPDYYENRHLVARALTVAKEQLGVEDNLTAMGAICQDFLEVHGVPTISANKFRMTQVAAQSLEIEEIGDDEDLDYEDEGKPLSLWERFWSWW